VLSIQMKFTLPCNNGVQLAIAAAHGASDIGKPPGLLAVYSLALLPVPGPACTAGFAFSSLLHFAGDMGMAGSLALHVTLAGMAVVSTELATSALLLYMNFIHIPILVAKLCASGSFYSVFAMMYTMLFFSRKQLPKLDNNGCFEFGHRMQLLVVCHVLLSYM
jgi:hypothetical protein